MQLDAEHLRDQHRHRLPEHRRLGLDAAHAPTEDPEAVDHRRVRVGPHEGVGIGLSGLLILEHDAREVLEVDLMDDARVGRHDREVVEGALSPAQEGVALVVSFELTLGVHAEGVMRRERIDLHRVVDHELGRRERVDPRGIAPHLSHRVTHRGQIDDRRHAGEVLHQDARGREGDLLAGLGLGVPAGERLDVGRRDRAVALGAKQVLEQHLQGEGEPRHVEATLKGLEAEDLIPPAAHLERVLGAKAVLRHVHLPGHLILYSDRPQSRRVVRAITARAEKGAQC